MEINIKITDPTIEQNVTEAFALEHGYQDQVPNINPQPVLAADRDATEEERAAFAAWTPTVANPVSKADFVRLCLIQIIKDKVARFQAAEHASSPETIAALDSAIS